MSRVYRLSKAGTKVLFKVRHHRGHGIHSPFVFNLIKNVIEEKHPYYYYSYLKEFLNAFGGKKLKFNKKNLLAFRLVNFFQAQTILEIGSGSGVNTLCLTAPSSDIKCTCIENDLDKFSLALKLYDEYDRHITLLHNFGEKNAQQGKLDCIYINLNNYDELSTDDLDALLSYCHPKSFMVLEGIRGNKTQNLIWRYLSQSKDRTAKLDLFDIGILFFDKQLSRWKYQISF